MHTTMFSLKRAYQRTLYGPARQLADLVDLTPARLDLLHAIKTSGLKEITQSAVRRILGVTAPTTSRMSRSLAALGYLTRRPCPTDARQVLLSLTKLALRALQIVADEDFSGVLDFAYESAVAITHYAPSRFDDFVSLNVLLRRVRHAFFDTATLFYPWYLDD